MMDSEEKSLNSTLINLLPFAGIVAIGLGRLFFGAVPILPRFFFYPAVILLIACPVFLIIAKFRLLKSFKASVGTRQLTSKERKYYYAAYFAMGLGVFIAVLTEK